MRFLLDTHVLIWALDQPERLPHDIRSLLEDPANAVYFSAVNIWEIAIKAALGKIDFPHAPLAIMQGALETGFVEYPIQAVYAARVADLFPPLTTGIPSIACSSRKHLACPLTY